VLRTTVRPGAGIAEAVEEGFVTTCWNCRLTGSGASGASLDAKRRFREQHRLGERVVYVLDEQDVQACVSSTNK
jgi:hypothetical protein